MSSRTYKVLLLCPLLGFGCSSKSSKDAQDASARYDTGARDIESQDSRYPDLPAVDLSRAPDTRDSAGHDNSVVDVVTKDVGTPIDATDVPLVRDTGVDHLAPIDVSSGKDLRPVGVDVAVDTAPAANGTCALPFPVPMDSSKTDLPVNTTDALHILDFPCASNGGDIVLEFDQPQSAPQLVYADTFGATWKTALFFSDSCAAAKPPKDNGLPVCSAGACATEQSQAAAVFGYGRHYLIVSGVDGEGGDVTVHLQFATVGTGPLANLPVGAGSLAGTASGIDTSSTCEASGPKNSYWWLTCPDDVGGAFSASTCNGANYDTVLSLQIPAKGAVVCNDDDPACGMQSTVGSTISAGAGVNVLTVAAALSSHYGDYSVTYSRP
jgi:hypothetical protein